MWLSFKGKKRHQEVMQACRTAVIEAVKASRTYGNFLSPCYAISFYPSTMDLLELLA